MKKTGILIWLLVLFFFSFVSSTLAAEKVKLRFFHSSTCKHCVSVKENYLPKIIDKYKDKIEIEYFNIADKESFKLYLATGERFNVKPKVPSILIGDYFLVGIKQITSQLEPTIDNYLKQLYKPKSFFSPIQINLFEKFSQFSAWTVIAAGLIDGINPCAFTVLIFFISFLTLMGYKRRELTAIGFSFILAVFLAYLGIGIGLFKGLYELKHFYYVIKGLYFALSVFCFTLAYLNIRDFFVYRKTKNTEDLKVKIPKPVRQRINAIIAKFYRKDAKEKSISILGLIITAFIVGFLVSILEAVCTGQVYLPTIVFILKESALRLKAIFYLLLYNFMFIAPLLLILLFALLGTSSQRFQEFFSKKIALIKILMFILFLGLGVFLLAGV